MKKNGYTLAEVLVTLGVIGLVAAITGPLITKFTPDAEKVAYLKTYDMLSKTINEIARNQTFYPPISEDKVKGNLVNYTNAPLLNLTGIKIGEIEIGGDNKIAKLFGYYTGLKKLEEVNNIKDNYQSEKYKEAPDFVTKDGAAIYMTTKINFPSDYKEDYQTEVYVDINGTAKGKNCLYDSKTCVKPDIFKFILTAYGELFPADDMGNYYLKTRNSWKASKDTIEQYTHPETIVDLTKLILNEDDGDGDGDGDIDGNLIPTPTPTPTPEGGGGEQGANNPCNFCAPPTWECKNGVCVNPYDYDRNKDKITGLKDWASSLDAPQYLKNTVSN